MKIHYRKNILERINDAIDMAEAEGRDIMAIDLLPREWTQFAIDLKKEISHQEHLEMMAASKGSCRMHRGVLIQLEKQS